MTWIRIEDDYLRHPKILAAGRDARDLDLAAMFYCSAHLTDGFVPMGALAVLAADAGITTSPRKALEALVAVKRADLTDGGWWVHDYLDYNRSRDEVERERKSNTDRVAAWRAGRRRRNGEHPDDGNGGSDAGSNASSNGVTSDVTPGVTTPVGNGGSTGCLRTHTHVHGDAPTNSERSLVQTDTMVVGAHGDSARQNALVAEDFEAFWAVYPRRVNKAPARTSYDRRRRAGRSAENLLAAATHMATWYAEHGDGELDFVPHAATFLNQRRDEEWQDGPPEGARTGARSGGRKTSALERNLRNLRNITPETDERGLDPEPEVDEL